MLVASQALLWLVVLLLSVVVFALARQIGVLHERIAPVGALAIGKGPQPGDAAPRVSASTLDGAIVHIGGAQPGTRLRMLFFVAPSCPVCKQLIPTAQHFARGEDVDLLFVGDDGVEPHRAMAEQHKIPLFSFAVSQNAALAYHVGKLPYAVLIEPAGSIVAQGLVNTREHLESLLTVAETGFTSIQDYLGARHKAHADARKESNG
jgi:methylamine dehydrogenase accessory protein MauD